MITRRDIIIAADTDGNVWIAQGAPAIARLFDELDVADHSGELYHSQLRHRCAYRDDDRLPTIGYPSNAPANALAMPSRMPKATGAPVMIGRV